MKYMMMIIHADPARFAALTKEERNQVHRDCGAWHEEIARSGHTIHAGALQPPSTATTFREKEGKLVVTDGPFAETKELLGGFEILECKDLDEAMAIVRRFPALKSGAAVELRPMIQGNDCTED